MTTQINWITSELLLTGATASGNTVNVVNSSFARIVLAAVATDGSKISYTFLDGDLPHGLVFSRNVLNKNDNILNVIPLDLPTGVLQGILDIYEDPNTTNSAKFSFSIKASNDAGLFSIKTFTMVVKFKNAYIPTSSITWITPAGVLGKYPEESYVSTQLKAIDGGKPELEYTVIAGKLTNGLQLYERSIGGETAGCIQGIPVVEKPAAFTEEIGQTFTVRAKNARGEVADRTFTIIINNIGGPKILPISDLPESKIKDTPIFSLGNYYDGYYLDLQLEAIDPNPRAILQWSIIDQPTGSGLPLGISLTTDGKLIGHIEPFVSTAAQAALYWDNIGWDYIPWDCQTPRAQSKTYYFTVRVFDGIQDDIRNYSLFVQAKGLLTVDNDNILIDNDALTVDLDNRHKPYITTLPQDLPEQRHLSNFAFKFDGRDFDGSEIRYAVVNADQGLFDQGTTEMYPLLPEVGFDQGPLTTSETTPPIVAFDQDTGDLPPGVTLDHVTGWLTGHLEEQIEEKRTYTFYIYCYKEMTRISSPDPLTGEVTIISLGRYVSDPVKFTLTVLGDLENVVTWSTPYDLGYMDNGEISEFAVSGSTTAIYKGITEPNYGKVKSLNYRLKEPLPSMLTYGVNGYLKYTTQARSKLPQGLKLLDNGLIVGRTTFEYFSLDGGETTIDNGTILFDYEYIFTITASDETPTHPPTISSDKTFRIRIKDYNKTPYENIYLRALTSPAQRMEFSSLLNDTNIFPPELIYRPSDPWFGKAKDIKFLFAAGMTPSSAAMYIESMSGHHYNKRVSLGEVKTAVALDVNYNVKYEVVYIDALDPQGKVAYAIDRESQVITQYKDLPFSVVYPNSFDNMHKEVGGVGYANRGAIPQWMLNQQEDGRVLGFTRGVILAYTVPGASKLIAYRLQHSENKFEFNSIDFVADRYQLDHVLSKNYDVANHKFYKSPETTFDRLDPLGGQRLYAGTEYTKEVAINDAILSGLHLTTDSEQIQTRVDSAVSAMPHIAVDFAVSKPFDEINGQTLSYILLHGGLDGVATIHTGQYLIFAKQENFTQTPDQLAMIRDPFDSNIFDRMLFDEGILPESYSNKENDGWNVMYGVYDDTTYSSTPYCPTGVVPGWNERLIAGDANVATRVKNQRAGIWKVVVTEENIVFLEFVIETNINEYVQVKNGQSYGDTRLYYDPVVKIGQTVPAYSLLSNKVRNSHDATRFDLGATRFFSNIDIYADPETDDVYLKFPKFNAYY
jgi:hypothetical protein